MGLATPGYDNSVTAMATGKPCALEGGGGHTRYPWSPLLCLGMSVSKQLTSSEYAEKYNLAECQLAILHCAGHHDPALVQKLWRELLTQELTSTQDLPEVTYW